MEKKSLIILADGFEEIEAVAVIDILRRGEINLTVAGLDKKEIKSARNLTINCDTSLSECGDDYDAIILPGGGGGATNLSRSQRVSDLLLKFNQDNKIIAAICATPAVVLTPLGILKNKAATCYTGMEESFDQTTTFSQDRVVIDGNIITSRGPGTAVSFGLAILEKLTDKTIVNKLKTDIIYKE